MRNQHMNYKRLHRQQEVKKQILFLIISIVIILVCSFTLTTSLSNAHNSDQSIYYKYYHHIRIDQNDSLWHLADTYMSNQYDSHQEYIDEVVSLNHLESSDTIIEGTYLIIPYYSTDFIID